MRKPLTYKQLWICLIAIELNMIGNLTFFSHSYFLYFDMVGTCFVAITLGIMCGVTVALATNVIMCLIMPGGESFVYFTIVNVTGALYWGFIAERGLLIQKRQNNDTPAIKDWPSWKYAIKITLIAIGAGIICSLPASILQRTLFNYNTLGYSSYLTKEFHSFTYSHIFPPFAIDWGADTILSITDKVITTFFGILISATILPAYAKRLNESYHQGKKYLHITFRNAQSDEYNNWLIYALYCIIVCIYSYLLWNGPKWNIEMISDTSPDGLMLSLSLLIPTILLFPFAFLLITSYTKKVIHHSSRKIFLNTQAIVKTLSLVLLVVLIEIFILFFLTDKSPTAFYEDKKLSVNIFSAIILSSLFIMLLMMKKKIDDESIDMMERCIREQHKLGVEDFVHTIKNEFIGNEAKDRIKMHSDKLLDNVNTDIKWHGLDKICEEINNDLDTPKKIEKRKAEGVHLIINTDFLQENISDIGCELNLYLLILTIREIVRNSNKAITRKQDSERENGNSFTGKIELNQSTTDNYYVLEISDNAGGVNDRELKKIYKEKIVSSRPDSGGEGTQMIKCYMERMHGEIKADNIESNGTKGLKTTINFPLYTRPK